MGPDRTAAEVLCAAKSLGADFSHAAMIGRQWLMTPPKTLAAVAEIHGGDATAVHEAKFAEPFFHMLGAESVESFDFSEYEGATHLHDMSNPIPDEYRSRYSLLFDGGSLEHVFNVPQAFRNCMEMVRVGGIFVQVSTGNNFMGHGFWQFSPELMYRIFSPENGFETLAVLVREIQQPWEDDYAGQYVIVRDPAQIGWRVELRNRRPTYIITLARKVSDGPIFSDWPKQSDYVRHWDSQEPQEPQQPQVRTRRIKKMVRSLIPTRIQKAILASYWSAAYIRISRADLMRGRLPTLPGTSAS